MAADCKGRKHTMEAKLEEDIFSPAVTVLAGTEKPTRESDPPFSSGCLDFLNAFSEKLRSSKQAGNDPEIMALAFWCRKAHLKLLQERHCDGHLRLGRGRLFHLAPSNVPMMCFYTWILGLLAGNAGIIRVSERLLSWDSVQAVLKVLQDLFSLEKYKRVQARTSFISYPHNDDTTRQILKSCDGRVLWGGDDTIRHIRKLDMPAHAVELAFPDRLSLAVIWGQTLKHLDDGTLKNLVHRFFNDTYTMDQRGCSSPQAMIWVEPSSGIRQRWWNLLAQEADRNYVVDGFRAARKLETAALASMQKGSLVESIRRYRGNALYVLSLSHIPEDLSACKGGFGLFYEADVSCLEEIFEHLSPQIQTLVCIGMDPARVARIAADMHSPGALRFVEPGRALELDTVWDGTDIIAALSRILW